MNNLDELTIKLDEIENIIKCLVNLLYFYSENSQNCRNMLTLARILDKKFETAFNLYDDICTSNNQQN